jgi:hypothetical protein
VTGGGIAQHEAALLPLSLGAGESLYLGYDGD